MMSSSMKVKKRSPTALNKRGNKIHCSDGYTFDSEKEHNFYHRFVKHSGYGFEVHPSFVLMPLTKINGANISSIGYTPDFIVKNKDGSWLHVYDVKNSFGPYGIDQAAKLRFRLFAVKYKHPVEAVVVRAHDFKAAVVGVTKQLNLNNSKGSAVPPPIIRQSLGYHWRDATNY